MPKAKTSTPVIDPSGFVDGFVEGYLQATNTPGIAVALIYEGQQYFYSFGSANVALKTPVTNETIFEIGSITKVFTAIMLSFKMGSSVFNNPITDYLPYTFPPNSAITKVTVSQLATHTSGMPKDGGGTPAEQLFTDQPPLTVLTDWWSTGFTSPPAPAAGTCWQYSNIGFVTLGYVVAGCNPNNYNGLLADIITGPLKMTQTGSSNPTGPSAAAGYVGPPNKRHRAKGTAADLKSSAQDMMTFLEICIYGQKHSGPHGLGNDISFTQQPIITNINDCSSGAPTKFQMGLAWQISQMTSNGKSFDLIAKDGETSLGGFQSWMGVVQDNMGIVLLSNKFMTAPANPPQSLATTGKAILQALLDISVTS
ncbi:MAG TPA: serine hydrolase domain-containing protein [Pyrinomonadaceae bacterium]|jgi:beta-lactamase class C